MENEEILLNLFVPKDLVIDLVALGFDAKCIAHFRGNAINANITITDEFSFKNLSDIEDSTNYWLIAPMYDQVLTWLISKNILIRPNYNNTAFELRAIEWEKDYYIEFKSKNDAIEKAINMLKGK